MMPRVVISELTDEAVVDGMRPLDEVVHRPDLVDRVGEVVAAPYAVPAS